MDGEGGGEGQVVVWGWFKCITVYCALYFYYYCISCTLDYQALDPGGWGSLLCLACCCSVVRLCPALPCQACLSLTISQGLLELMSFESVMLSNHLILYHPLLLHPLPPASAFNLSQHQGLFQWVSSSHKVAKVLELQLQHQSFQWIFRTDFL